jgi:hypothetical protein
VGDKASKLILAVLQELEVKDPVVEAFEKAKLERVSDLGKKRPEAEAKIKKTAPKNDAVLKGLLAAWDEENAQASGAAFPPLPADKQIPARR